MTGNSNPLVSVIIPLYNAEKYIVETIESVINQTYKNWEMIVADDCSTDKSRDIVKEYVKKDNRIKLIESETNFGGPARPRNIGLDNAIGEYIAFLDADDIWLEEKLDVQIKIMIANNLTFTSTDCSLLNKNSSEFFTSKLSQIYNKKISKKTICDLVKNNFILTSSVLVRKNKNLIFSEDRDLISVEDFDLWLKILISDINSYKFIEEKLIKYRILDTSISDRNNIYAQEIKANLAVVKLMINNSNLINCWLYRIIFNILRKKIFG